MTKNICLKGMFVATEGGPPISSVVRCEVLLPQLAGSLPPVARFVLQAVGRVVRTEAADGGFGLLTRVTVLADSISRPSLV